LVCVKLSTETILRSIGQSTLMNYHLLTCLLLAIKTHVLLETLCDGLFICVVQ